MSKVELLKDVLIEIGQIERYFGNTVPVNLWRAKKIKDPIGQLFKLVEEELTRPRGAPRKPDITIEGDWVRVRERPRGISTFDKPDTFKGKWEYFKIPAGTILPDGLVIVKDNYNSAFGATHYTIAPERDMPLTRFKQQLSVLIDLVEKENASGN
ncbi:MAG: hypothetical protein OEZ68_06015 [Gammaproteobacteria bacterium]|nr:hypothetical protein [Gammaproteobacteria bacterium]